ncbi:hypothetical protein JHE00_03690 [Prauserella sp. ASG 168]|uniref:Uncharacterized protein n=1 Tax=Prauserella cavernicola TaxID=2800127 RepID=A0A934V2R4_9PSEU|nr:hypothetical protein [Prauserella cavernicola]
MPTAESELKLVTKELSQLWLRPGERLLLACVPISGYVGLLLDGELRLPHEPLSPMPEVTLGTPRWPLPAAFTIESRGADWADDPTVAFWASARDPAQHAVRFADHFAHSQGEAGLTLTSQRVAVVYPARILADAASRHAFVTVCELAPQSVRSVSGAHVGRSIPNPLVIRVDFADGSTLFVRDPLAARRLTPGT